MQTNSVEIRPETYSGPLTENPLIVELLGILAKNKATEQYVEFSQLVSCVSAMEEQLNQTATELSAVMQELRTLQNSLSKEDKASLSSLSASLGTAVKKGREQLNSLKGRILRAAQTTVKGLKDRGVIGLAGALEALGVRKAITALQNHFGSTARTVETGIARMEAVGQELRGVGSHVRNIGRVLSGKERQEAEQSRGEMAVLAPFRHIRDALRKAENLAGQAVGSLEKLERSANERKPSIKEALKDYESNRPTLAKKPVEKEQGAR